jgi:excisionase family DNA binding protein
MLTALKLWCHYIDMTDHLMTPQEVASYLKVSRQSIYQLIDSGKLEAMRIGRNRRITQGSLRNYLEQATTPYEVIR